MLTAARVTRQIGVRSPGQSREGLESSSNITRSVIGQTSVQRKVGTSNLRTRPEIQSSSCFSRKSCFRGKRKTLYMMTLESDSADCVLRGRKSVVSWVLTSPVCCRGFVVEMNQPSRCSPSGHVEGLTEEVALFWPRRMRFSS